MALYKSHYPELGFYVNGSLRKFTNGQYKTNDPKEIKVLDALKDAKRVDEPKAEEPRETEEPKKTVKRSKSSAK